MVSLIVVVMPASVHIFGNKLRTRVFVNSGMVIHRGSTYWMPVWKYMWFERDMKEEISFHQADWNATGDVRFKKLGEYEYLLVRTSNGWFKLQAYTF